MYTSGNLVQFNDLRAFDGLGIFLFFNEGPAGIPGGGGAPVQCVHLYYVAKNVLIGYLVEVGPLVQLVGVGLEEVEVRQQAEGLQLLPEFHQT